MYHPELTDEVLIEKVQAESKRRGIPMTTLLNEWIAEKVAELEQHKATDKRRWPRMWLYYGRTPVGWVPLDPRNPREGMDKWLARQYKIEAEFQKHLKEGNTILYYDNSKPPPY